MNLEGPLPTLLTLLICSGMLAILFNFEKFFSKKSEKEDKSGAGAEIAAAIAAVKSRTSAN